MNLVHPPSVGIEGSRFTFLSIPFNYLEEPMFEVFASVKLEWKYYLYVYENEKVWEQIKHVNDIQQIISIRFFFYLSIQSWKQYFAIESI